MNCFRVELPVFQEFNIHELLVPFNHQINRRGGDSHHLGNAAQHAEAAGNVFLEEPALDVGLETACTNTLPSILTTLKTVSIRETAGRTVGRQEDSPAIIVRKKEGR